jgi:hypothetical protein
MMICQTVGILKRDQEWASDHFFGIVEDRAAGKCLMPLYDR